MKIAIIGGSIAGLCTGLALQCNGHQVSIYEQSTADMKGKGAGIGLLDEMMDYLEEHDISSRKNIGIELHTRQVLNDKGYPALTYPNKATFTSWDTVYRQLKNMFPEKDYKSLHKLTQFQQNGDYIQLGFENGNRAVAEMVVGADGYNSFIRHQFLPEIEPLYAGYMALRGIIPFSEIPKELVNMLLYKFTYVSKEGSMFFCYFIPGEKGEKVVESTRLNWIWYTHKSSGELKDILRDKNGFEHHLSLSSGLMREEVRNSLLEQSSKSIPPNIHRLLQITDFPFVQAIVDMEVPAMQFGRSVILGDAAFVVRPHTAGGATKASQDGIALATALKFHTNFSSALLHWEYERLKYGKSLAERGKSLAKRYGME